MREAPTLVVATRCPYCQRLVELVDGALARHGVQVRRPAPVMEFPDAEEPTLVTCGGSGARVVVAP